MIKAGAYAEKLGEGRIMCRLCPAHCRFREGRRGICGSRFMKDGKLVTDNYGELVTMAVDPIEKKPLYHFYPGSDIVSTGANGCNFRCLNCQNWSISQERVPTTYVDPERLVQAARQYDSIGVAFTYTEPMIWYEYIMDVAPLLHEAGLKVVLVSNGYVDPEPLEDLIPVIDAINVDLKGMRPEFYRRICKGKLQPILDNIRTLGNSDVHLEITNLIIPTLNDTEKDFRALVDFVADISDMIPLHLSAYRPDYRLDAPATPVATLRLARDIARRRLKYVYLGNVRDDDSDTICPHCESVLITRTGYRTLVQGMEGSRCRSCGAETGIVR